MSLTLHTTEIWLSTVTDSGGMKDRTHGIFLQNDSGRENTDREQGGSQALVQMPWGRRAGAGPFRVRTGASPLAPQ